MIADAAADVTAISSLIVALATLLAVILANRKIGAVHQEVRTSNGLSIGQLADSDEGRRVLETLPNPADRTASEQAYVEGLGRTDE